MWGAGKKTLEIILKADPSRMTVYQDYRASCSDQGRLEFVTKGKQGSLFIPTHPVFLREQVGIMKANRPITL